MRVLHVAPSYFPAIYWGGPVFSTYGLNNALAALPGLELRVLTTDSAGVHPAERLDVKQIDFGTLYPGYCVYFTRRVIGLSTSPGLFARLPGLMHWAEVVHLTATYSFPTLPVLFLGWLYRKPVIWSPRGALLEYDSFDRARKKQLKRLWNYLCNLMVRAGNVILHTTSEADRMSSLRHIQDGKAVVIRNGIEIPTAGSDRPYMPNGELRLLFLGRIHPIKGLENLLDSMQLLGDPTITLSIYGDGDASYISDLKARARRLGLSDRAVCFLGQAGESLKRTAFMNAEVCIVPSHSENFGMVVAEALAHAVPVIVSQHAPWQQIEDRRCGLWVDNSPESLAVSIRSIRRMDLAGMGARGREWMAAEFSWTAVAREMLELYHSAHSVRSMY